MAMKSEATSKSKFKRSVARRLIFYILLFSSLITFLGTSLQLYLDYSKDVSLIEERMNQIEGSYLPSVINRLWVSDHEQLKIQLNGMLQLPDMQYLKIEVDGRTIISVGAPQSENIISRTFPLFYTYRNRIIHLGDLYVYASLTGVYRRLLDKVLIILTTQAVKTFLVSSFIFIIFYFLVGKHLGTMAAYAKSLDISHLESPLELQRRPRAGDEKDELEQLVVSVNEMRVNLKNSYNELRLANELLESEIEHRIEAEKESLRLVAAIENVVEAIIITDTSGTIKYVNPAFESITGHPRAAAVGASLKDFMNDKNNQALYDEIWGNLGQGGAWKGRFTSEKKDGSHVVEDVTISPIFDSARNIVNFVAVLRDATREEMYEKRFRQTQKMEAIGTLAGGIAHDFNNILSPIIGYTQLLLRRADGHDSQREILEEILTASKMAKALIRQILTFSRLSDEKFKPIQPGAVVKEALKLIRASMPSSITIQTELSPKCGTILSDPSLVSQLVMNLCANAGHAMRDNGGTLRVALERISVTGDFEIEKTALQTGNLVPGLYVRLSVSDTATGMDRNILERIFEPFFTTKKVGEGTGMGLAIVHGIVSSQGGAITVRSETGYGTRFDVYLPLAGECEEIDDDDNTGDIPGGNEKILYVEDEEHVALAVVKMLEDLGYQVEHHHNPRTALDVFKTRFKQYDLILTDQTMPGVTGMELAREALTVNPGIPVIICSGFSAATNRKRVRAIGAREFMIKPLVNESDVVFVAEFASQVHSSNDSPASTP